MRLQKVYNATLEEEKALINVDTKKVLLTMRTKNSF